MLFFVWYVASVCGYSVEILLVTLADRGVVYSMLQYWWKGYERPYLCSSHLPLCLSPIADCIFVAGMKMFPKLLG